MLQVQLRVLKGKRVTIKGAAIMIFDSSVLNGQMKRTQRRVDETITTLVATQHPCPLCATIGATMKQSPMTTCDRCDLYRTIIDNHHRDKSLVRHV